MTRLRHLLGAKLIIGLRWRELPRRAGHREELRAILRGEGAVMGVEVSIPAKVAGDGDRALCGVVPGRPGLVNRWRGAVSGALWFARATHANLLWVERLADGNYWVLGVRDHAIDLRTDVVLTPGNLDAFVRSLAQEDREFGLAPLEIVGHGFDPAHCSLLERAQQRSLQDQLRQVPPDQALQVRRLTGVPPAALVTAAAVVVAGLVVVWVWRDRQASRARAALAELEAARGPHGSTQPFEALRLARIEAAVAAAIAEDTGTPAPTALASACRHARDRVPSWAAGWELQSLSCAPAAVGRYQRAAGNNLTLAAALPAAQFSVEPDTASVPLALPASAPRSPLSAEQLPVFERWFPAWEAGFQDVANLFPQFTYQVTPPAPREVLYQDPEDDAGPPRPVPPQHQYRQGPFTLAGVDLATLTLIAPLGANVRIDELVINTSRDAFRWTLRGTYFTR